MSERNGLHSNDDVTARWSSNQRRAYAQTPTLLRDREEDDLLSARSYNARQQPYNLKQGFMAWWPDHLRAQEHHEPVTAARKRALLLSYLPDWIISILFLVLFGLIDKVDGFKRQFSLSDTSIQHTYAVQERIPFWLCLVLSVVVPIVIISTISIVFRRSFWDLHNGLLGLLLAESTTLAFTDCIKITVGRPRPDLIDRCQPVAGAVNAAVYGLCNYTICTQTDSHILRDGFKSFISGHSSSAFAGLGYLSLYLAGKLHLFDRQGHSLKSWIALAPLLGATLIAISRTMDYRHHATDVLAGGTVGFLLACFSYLQYYPLLQSPLCHLPYSPRVPAGPRSTLDQLAQDRRGASLSHDLDQNTAPRPSEEHNKPDADEEEGFGLV